MEEKYIELKLTDGEMYFLKDQLAMRLASITKSIKILEEKGDEYSNEIYTLKMDKRICDKLRKYIEYAMR